MPLVRQTFPVGALGCNCTIVSCPETQEALVIDPGDEAPEILAALARAGLRAVKIVHTHAHFDHVMATGDVAAGTGADVLLHHEDRWLYDNAVMQTELFGLARRRRSRPARPHARAARRRGDRLRPPRGPRHPHPRPHPGFDLPLLRGIRADPRAVRGRHAVQGVDRPHGPVGGLASRPSRTRSATA